MVAAQNKEVTSDSENENNVGQDGGMISDSPVNSPIPHMRSISEKQVKTCIKVKYRSYKLTALLDTGSDITIAGRDIADRCGWSMESRDVAPIKMANDDVIAIDGIATVEIKLNGTSTEIDVYVTRDINGLILGIDWMTKQGPFTFDFPNDRIRFGEGKWLALVKEEKSRMLRNAGAM